MIDMTIDSIGVMTKSGAITESGLLTAARYGLENAARELFGECMVVTESL